MAEEAWLLAEGDDPKLLVLEGVEGLWRKHIKNMPAEYAIWANLPDNPNLN